MLSLIISQVSNNDSSVLGVLIAAVAVMVLFLGVFLLIRSIMLWYWKIDVIVANQAQQTIGLEQIHQTLKEQNKILTELKHQLGNNPNDPNAQELRP